MIRCKTARFRLMIPGAAFAGALVCLVALASPPGAAGARPGQTGQIAFASEAGGIFVMRADGTHVRRLRHDGHFYWNPDFSPNGDEIAVARGRGSHDIFTMKSDGSRLRRVTHNPDARNDDPSFSSNGKRIAFDRGRGVANVFTIRVDGTHQHQVTSFAPSEHHFTGAFNPSFSPAGGEIAFTGFRHGRYAIFTIRANGARQRQIIQDPYGYEVDATVDFSPNGKRIAFVRRQGGHWQIFAMRSDGTHVRQLTHQPASSFSPTFSPHGGKIAFSRQGDIFVMRANGTHVHRVTHGERDEEVPTWGVGP